MTLVPCRSFEEMEAQISAGMKTPVLSVRPGPEGSAGDKGRKRESEALSRTQSTERDEQVRQMAFIKPVKIKKKKVSFMCSLTATCCKSATFPLTFNATLLFSHDTNVCRNHRPRLSLSLAVTLSETLSSQTAKTFHF